MRERERERDRERKNFSKGQEQWKGNRGSIPSREFINVVDKVGTSFFFTNFPEGWTRPSMWKYFLMFGHVIDIFIPYKKSKERKSFGFVKYKEVKDAERLVKQIQMVVVGAEKLVINVAKFKRGREGERVQSGHRQGGAEVTKEITQRNTQHVDRHRTYAVMVKEDDIEKLPPLGEKNQTKTVVASSRVEDKEWLKRCVVGEMKNVALLEKVRGILEDEGYHDCKAKYLGGLRVLLECSAVEGVEKIIKGKKKLQEWFKDVVPWNLDTELERPGRITWLNISGVPIHGWHTETFQRIAKQWGEVIEVEDFTSAREQVNIGRTCIVTKQQESINDVINVGVDEQLFKVRVVEDFVEVVDFGQRYASRVKFDESESEMEEEEDWNSVEGWMAEGDSVSDSVSEWRLIKNGQKPPLEAGLLALAKSGDCDNTWDLSCAGSQWKKAEESDEKSLQEESVGTVVEETERDSDKEKDMLMLGGGTVQSLLGLGNKETGPLLINVSTEEDLPGSKSRQINGLGAARLEQHEDQEENRPKSTINGADTMEESRSMNPAGSPILQKFSELQDIVGDANDPNPATDRSEARQPNNHPSVSTSEVVKVMERTGPTTRRQSQRISSKKAQTTEAKEKKKWGISGRKITKETRLKENKDHKGLGKNSARQGINEPTKSDSSRGLRALGAATSVAEIQESIEPESSVSRTQKFGALMRLVYKRRDVMAPAKDSAPGEVVVVK